MDRILRHNNGQWGPFYSSSSVQRALLVQSQRPGRGKGNGFINLVRMYLIPFIGDAPGNTWGCICQFRSSDTSIWHFWILNALAVESSTCRYVESVLFASIIGNFTCAAIFKNISDLLHITPLQHISNARINGQTVQHKNMPGLQWTSMLWKAQIALSNSLSVWNCSSGHGTF